MRPRRIVAAAALLVGCSTAPAVPVAPASADAVAGLPPCEERVSESEAADVDGLRLPAEAVVTSVAEEGPVTQVTGFAPLTPVQVREAYRTLDGITIELIEDEGFEAEVLYRDAGKSVYVKALAVCDRGSDLLLVVGPANGRAVPSPSGTAG